MTRSILADAFDHHVWASLKVLDACGGLTDEELATTVPGTYGTLIDTLRHLVGADRWYLFVQTDGRVDQIEEAAMSVADLRAVMEPNAGFWAEVLAASPDPDGDKVYHRDDGSAAHATWGVRLAQVIHHGTDHRSQVCTTLTTMGITPPEIDVWDWGTTTGKVRTDEAVPAG
jgi:uncharacterized damage-inducible protein DinB